EDFCRVFDDFNDAMERAKLSPFATVFQNKYSAVLPVDRKLYAENGECAFCLTRPAEDYFEEKPICRHCLALIEEIGQKLPKAKYLVLSRTKGGLELFGGLFLRLLEGDDLASFARATEILNIRDYSAFTSAPIAGYIPVVTALDLKRWTDTSQLKEQNGKKVVADEEVKKDVPKTFAILAEEAKIFEDKSVRSINCLASCKADVDNLGLLFGIGLVQAKKVNFPFRVWPCCHACSITSLPLICPSFCKGNFPISMSSLPVAMIFLF
ncbi:MAG: hypothetical protein IJS50_05715, partial [Desulfovibrio sp.]|nr:hypothetical protein [Desulfovibrio sp.]